VAQPTTEPEAPAAPEESVLRRGGAATAILRAFVVRREASIVLVAIALVIYFQSVNSNFLSAGNLPVIAQFVAAAAIIAAGEVMLMIGGEIDLSVGQVFALSPFIMFFAMEDYGLPFALAVVAALLVSAFIGLVNGTITCLLGVPSFITTLGTLFLINGLTLTISDGFPRAVPDVSVANIFGAANYSEFIWAVVIILAVHTVLRLTPWGLHTVAGGGNPLGAREAGVRVNYVKIGNFMLCSVLGGFAGILDSTRITSILPLQGGTDIMFLGVAAAVIGGTSLMGGSGTIIGGFLGVIVLAILNIGFTILGVSAFNFDLIIGIAILAAMILNVQIQRLKNLGQIGRRGR
jgi:simple sugar transport system permease protein